MDHWSRISQIDSEEHFTQIALDIFRFQHEHNPVYRSFCDLLYIHPSEIKSLNQIPFLPIQFFKTHKILSTDNPIVKEFTSSSTTGQIPSTHYITDLDLYQKSFISGFETFYGPLKDYTVLALLPSYLERTGSSLIHMVDHMISVSPFSESGFFLNNLDVLSGLLSKLDSEGRKILLIGVSFALLDLIENFSFDLSNTIVMETGGMKGRRKELVRQDLHKQLKTGFGVDAIHSEYGMTELLSQAYSQGDGIFRTPPWLKVMIRDSEDPLSVLGQNKTGGINVIDLANIHSCSFIATQDLGKIHGDGTFEILGRFDHSDVRGCNLMVL